VEMFGIILCKYVLLIDCDWLLIIHGLLVLMYGGFSQR